MIDADHAQPCGLIAASSSAIALTWFPGLTPTAIRLLATGISVLTGRPTTYVQIFAGTEEQIISAIVAAKTRTLGATTISPADPVSRSGAEREGALPYRFLMFLRLSGTRPGRTSGGGTALPI